MRPMRLPFVLLLFIAMLPAATVRADHDDAKRGAVLRDISRDDKLFPVEVNNWWGLMNKAGTLVVYPQFAWADYSFEGRTRVVVDGRTGFISNGLNWLIEPRLAYADRYANGVAIVGDGDHFGYIDKTPQLLVPMKLDGALRFRENYAAVQVDDLCGFINRKGELAIPLRFAHVRSFHDGLAVAQLPGTPGRAGPIGYIDKRGEWIFRDDARRFERLGDFNQNLARAKQTDGKWGYIDKRFEWVIAPQFDGARDFTGGIAAVKAGEKWGYIDKSGRVVAPARFDRADDLDEKLAMVQVGDRFGYINRAGRMAIEPQFTRALPFFRGLARVSFEPSFAYVDLSLNVAWNPRAPLVAIRDQTLESQARIIVRQKLNIPHRSDRIGPPPRREPAPTPYAPEFLYEEKLPNPLQLRWQQLHPDRRLP